MPLWEVWVAKDDAESVCFRADVCSDVQYRLLTRTVYDKPMLFVASFRERSTRKAFDASKDILFSEEGKA